MLLKKNSDSLKFVLDTVPITGIEDDQYLISKTADGVIYAGAVKVPGIDIKNYQNMDRQISFLAYGNGVLLSELYSKEIFVGGKADYSDQIGWIGRKESQQNDEFCRDILADMRRLITHFGEMNEERFSYVLFFSEDKNKIDVEIDRFSRNLGLARIQPQKCDRSDFLQLYSILLKGETSDE